MHGMLLYCVRAIVTCALIIPAKALFQDIHYIPDRSISGQAQIPLKIQPVNTGHPLVGGARYFCGYLMSSVSDRLGSAVAAFARLFFDRPISWGHLARGLDAGIGQ